MLNYIVLNGFSLGQSKEQNFHPQTSGLQVVLLSAIYTQQISCTKAKQALWNFFHVLSAVCSHSQN